MLHNVWKKATLFLIKNKIRNNSKIKNHRSSNKRKRFTFYSCLSQIFYDICISNNAKTIKNKYYAS